ncbi:hypothetical protein CBM2637_B100267 [Cupriavidus taiwanensis]|nr:hypothetical protein CBM2637_B100267 [Cupriavidus taiwanensis]
MRQDLDAARRFQRVHGQERIRHGAPAGEQPVVAQDHLLAAAQVGHQPRFLVLAQRHAFIVVIGEPAQREHRLLRDRQQPLLLRGHGDAVRGMRVHHAADFGPRLVHGAVDDEAGRVDVIRRVQHGLAVVVHLDQARRRDLVEHHAVRVDQELVRRVRHARRDMREDQVVPAEVRHQPVRGRQVDAHLPFGVGDAVFYGFDELDLRHVRPPRGHVSESLDRCIVPAPRAKVC